MFKDLKRDDKVKLLLYRLYLIEFQKKPFNERTQHQFKEICSYVEKNDLHGVDLPEEFDSFESIIVKIKLKSLLEGKTNGKTTTKRVPDRRTNPFLS